MKIISLIIFLFAACFLCNSRGICGQGKEEISCADCEHWEAAECQEE